MIEKIIYEGQVFYPQKHPYAILIFPLIQLKRFFQFLYQFLIQLLWNELIWGRKAHSEAIGSFAFLLFLLLSWISFLIKHYFLFSLIIFLVIWYIDYGIAQKAYRHGKYNRPLYLSQQSDEQVDWSVVLSPQQILHHTFIWGQVREIAIASFEVKGGAFQEELGTIWQAKLLLYDGSEWVITEQENLLGVLQAVKTLAHYTDGPIVFKDSYGLGKYAARSIESAPTFSLPNHYEGVKYHQSDRKWHIASAWHFRHSWQLFKQIFRESGFLFFMLILSNIMVFVGGIINHLVESFHRHNPIEIDFSTPIDQLFPFWTWRSSLILALAIAAMIYKGWQLSRVKHCFIDHYFLRLSIDNRSIGKIPISEIESLLLVGEMEPKILIIGKNSALVIPKMQHQEDSLLYLTYLQEAVDYFQSPDPDQSETGLASET